MPGLVHAWPKSAACWSPTMPAIGSDVPRTAASVSPTTPQLSTTAGMTARGMSQQLEQLVVPVPAPQVVEHGARRVGGVGHVQPSAAEHPDQPGVHRAEGELAASRPVRGSGHRLQDPAQLGRREVGIQEQARTRAHQRLEAIAAQLVTYARRSPVLPDDGRGDRARGGSLPHDGGLALVRDADGRDRSSRQAAETQRLHCRGALRLPDLQRVLLDPAGVREALPGLVLRAGQNATLSVDDQSSRARGALIQGEQYLHCDPCSRLGGAGTVSGLLAE